MRILARLVPLVLVVLSLPPAAAADAPVALELGGGTRTIELMEPVRLRPDGDVLRGTFRLLVDETYADGSEDWTALASLHDVRGASGEVPVERAVIRRRSVHVYERGGTTGGRVDADAHLLRVAGERRDAAYHRSFVVTCDVTVFARAAHARDLTATLDLTLLQ